MAAGTVKCPMCGASSDKDKTKCAHCGAALATVACPSCFGMIFMGAKFCSHCGAKQSRKEGATVGLKCPRCGDAFRSIVVGKAELCECPRCQGIWASPDQIEQICADRHGEAATLGAARPVQDQPRIEASIRYLPCPACSKLMNRVNFARCSTVVVDVCKAHGTWFDKDELRRIVEFVRAGGLDRARAREIEELEEREKRLKRKQAAPARLAGMPSDTLDDGLWSAAISLGKLFQ